MFKLLKMPVFINCNFESRLKKCITKCKSNFLKSCSINIKIPFYGEPLTIFSICKSYYIFFQYKANSWFCSSINNVLRCDFWEVFIYLYFQIIQQITRRAFIWANKKHIWKQTNFGDDFKEALSASA